MNCPVERPGSNSVPRVLDVFLAELMSKNVEARNTEGMRRVADFLCDVNLGLLSPSEEAWKPLLTQTYLRFKVLGDAMMALCREERPEESLALSERFKGAGFGSQLMRRMRVTGAPSKEAIAYLKSVDALSRAVESLKAPITPHPQQLIDWTLQAGQEVSRRGETLSESDPILYARLGGLVPPQDLLGAFPQADPLAILDLAVTNEGSIVHVLRRHQGTVSVTAVLAADFTLKHVRDLMLVWGRGNVVHEITTRQRQALNDITETLHDRLLCNLAKILSQQGIRQLVFVPDAFTSFLPFHLSRVCPKDIGIEIDGLDLSKSTLLGEFFPITYVPCLQAIAISLHQKRPREVSRVASFSDPLSDLAGARNTSRWLSSGLPKSVRHLSFVGDEATVDKLRKVLQEAQVAVINTHGVADLNHPDESHLVFHDGKWTMDDILDHSLFQSSPMFVLSACEVGGTSADAGLMPSSFPGGIPGALISSGAACVLACMWPVEDISIGYVVERFLVHLSHPGFSPAAALFRAQYDLRHLSKKQILERCVNLLDQMARDGSADKLSDEYIQLDQVKDVISKADSNYPFADAQYWGGIVVVGCGWSTPAGAQVMDLHGMELMIRSEVEIGRAAELMSHGEYHRAEEVLEGILPQSEGPQRLRITRALADAVWRHGMQSDPTAAGRRAIELLMQAEFLARSEQDEQSLREIVETRQRIEKLWSVER